MCPKNSKKNSAGRARGDDGGGGSCEALRVSVRTLDYLLNEMGNHWGFVQQTGMVLKVHSEKKKVHPCCCVENSLCSDGSGNESRWYRAAGMRGREVVRRGWIPDI